MCIIQNHFRSNYIQSRDNFRHIFLTIIRVSVASHYTLYVTSSKLFFVLNLRPIAVHAGSFPLQLLLWLCISYNWYSFMYILFFIQNTFIDAQAPPIQIRHQICKRLYTIQKHFNTNIFIVSIAMFKTTTYLDYSCINILLNIFC